VVGGVWGPEENVKRKIRTTTTFHLGLQNSYKICFFPFPFKCSFYNAVICSTYYLQAKWLRFFTFILSLMDHSFSHIVFGHVSTWSNEFSAHTLPLKILLVNFPLLFRSCLLLMTPLLKITMWTTLILDRYIEMHMIGDQPVSLTKYTEFACLVCFNKNWSIHSPKALLGTPY